MSMRKFANQGGCTLSTTKSESFGNTFIESMVCGVPVVASKMMPVTELVVQGKTGLLLSWTKCARCGQATISYFRSS